MNADNIVMLIVAVSMLIISVSFVVHIVFSMIVGGCLQ